MWLQFPPEQVALQGLPAGQVTLHSPCTQFEAFASPSAALPGPTSSAPPPSVILPSLPTVTPSAPPTFTPSLPTATPSPTLTPSFEISIAFSGGFSLRLQARSASASSRGVVFANFISGSTLRGDLADEKKRHTTARRERRA